MPFQIVRNDITKMQVDAIVNTANPMPGYGSGIDSAVYEVAGKDKLLRKRHEIGAIDQGTSVMTEGYRLPAKYIIHTVGAAWQCGNAGEEDIIRKCYKSVFQIAMENDLTSLAIPLLASGSYGFPKGIALRIALSEIESFMSTSDMEVYLVVFDNKSVSLSSELYGDIEEYISDNYVEEKYQEEYPDLFLELCSPLFEEQRSLDDILNNLGKTFMELVFSFADAKGMTDVDVQKKANLDRKTFSKLKCGTTKNPSKTTALALAIALELNIDETEDLLSRAGLALSPCSKQDVIVQYFIEKEAYDIYEINVALFEHGVPLLGKSV